MRLINKITIVILTILVVQIPIPVLADTAVTSYVQFENGGLDMSADDMNFGTLDTSNLEETDNQTFLNGFGHILAYSGNGNLKVADNRLDSNDGYTVSVSVPDDNWYDDDDEPIAGNQTLGIVCQNGDDMAALGNYETQILDITQSPIGYEATAPYSGCYAIVVPASVDVSDIIGETIHTTLKWTLNDTPVS